jgi:hypothetical protein
MAYNSKPFLKKVHEAVNDAQGRGFSEKYIDTYRRLDYSGDNVPEASCYYPRQNFAPPYHFGRLVPQPAADPYSTYGTVSPNYSHLTRATRFTQVWLEKNNYAYDMISDLDLHSIPDVLQGYRTVILAGHSEYWTFPAYNRVKSYLGSGGRLIVLSGNTMYWRVSFDPTGTVMECRKVDGVGAEIVQSRRGEAWHGDDGLRGGLMRECGFPGWQVSGLETFGVLGVCCAPGCAGGPGTDYCGTFYVSNPNHFLFQGLGVNDKQAFAVNMVGHESDLRVKTMEDFRIAPGGNSVPPGATSPAEPTPTEITTLAVAKNGKGSFSDYFDQPLPARYLPPDDPTQQTVVGEMIYWERSAGGRVFNAGAIGNGLALLNDATFSKLLRNVVLRFLTT